MDSRLRLKRTIEMIEGAYAPSTIRAYKGNFEKFLQFCESEISQALPAHPATIAKFIQKLTKDGLKSASIRLAFASISTIHKLNELPDPTNSPAAKLELRRMHRTLGRTSKQAFGITGPILMRMFNATTNDLRGLRDKALLLTAYDSLCRRSEIALLKTTDIDDEKSRIRLSKSKTDQDSIGVWIQLNSSTHTAVHEWLKKANIKDGFVFRGITTRGTVTASIGSGQINRIFKKIARAAHIKEEDIKNISGHSLRVGAAQDLLNSGASLPVIMSKGRWSKSDTAMRYVENHSS